MIEFDPDGASCFGYAARNTEFSIAENSNVINITASPQKIILKIS